MNRIEKVECLIAQLYESPDGSVGGYGHLVFDDDNNIDDWVIDDCLEKAINNPSDFICEETRLISIIALTAFSILTDDERESVVENYRYSNGTKGLNV